MRLVHVCAVAVGVSLVTGFGSDGSASVERTRPAAAASAQACGGPCMLFVTRHGAGTVTDEAGWIDCGLRCEAGYAEGERVTLSARPSPGHTFLGWTGCTETTGTGLCVVLTWGTDCIGARFSGEGSTAPGWGCAPGSEVPLPPDPRSPDPTDHPPLGSVCTIVGSPRADVITGTFATDVICGGSGNDVISGGGGHDLIFGGRGSDRLSGGPGREHLLGGPGNDVLVGGRDDDELFGQRGADRLLSRDGVADYVNGGPGIDRARFDTRDVVRAVERRS